MSDNKRGGKRERAGRKTLPVSERLYPVTVRLSQEQIAYCRTHDCGVSEFVRKLVEEKKWWQELLREFAE